jgi:predicted acyltransferase
MNPLFIYILMMSYQELIIYNIVFKVNGEKTSLWQYMYDNILGSWISNAYVGSTLWGIFFLIMYLAIAYLLYRKNIFIKL